ncbi:MAG: DUF116 domain-containing protein [Candidatus Aenigmatarchaeota archaeon]
MPYKFNFDFSGLPKKFFSEIIEISYEKELHRRATDKIKGLIKKFKLDEITGLDLSCMLNAIGDLIEIYTLNNFYRNDFEKTNKRALLLPHCSRKYMDSNCKAAFNPSLPSYFCNSCSSDCLIYKASKVGKEKGYDIYILPGSSCIPKIIESYEGIVGVACGEELKLAKKFLEIPAQGLPLIKNGCANTKFNLEMFEKIL